MNKVKFNIKNVHYAKQIITNGELSYATPVKEPGAVSISLDPEGEMEPFYADGYVYYMANGNQGYSGDLEMAKFSDSFRTDILGETIDENGLILEDANAEPAKFALLFQFDGDVNEVLHVLYNCTASRIAIASQTNEDSKEVQTETSTITASPLENGIVKGKLEDRTATAYTNFFTAVQMPSSMTGSGVV